MMEDSEMQCLIKNSINKNTEKTTKFAVSVFEGWRQKRVSSGSENIPELLTMTKEETSCWLARFVIYFMDSLIIR